MAVGDITLSRAQKRSLASVANSAMNNIVSQDRDAKFAWKHSFGHVDHNATVNALIKRGIVDTGADGLQLNPLGIILAKESWSEIYDGDWNTVLAEKVKEKEEKAARVERERQEWKAYVEKLPVPEGYEVLAIGNFDIEWRPEEFAFAPTIRIGDKNAPFYGQSRYYAPEWEINVGAVGAMSLERVNTFYRALDMARLVLMEMRERYASVEVKSLD